MRAPATLLEAGLTATAALVLLTACGGSGDEAPEAAASSAASSSSSAASGGSDDPEVQAFCDQAETVLTQVSTSLSTTDPAAVAPALAQAVADLQTVQAPAEISADWESAEQLFVGLRDAVDGVDLDTPEGQATVQQEATRLQEETGDAQTRLDAWTSQNCGG